MFIDVNEAITVPLPPSLRPVNDVIPLLVESHEIHIEHPMSRSSGQTMILKTSHLCQWLESVASFYTTLTAQRLLLNRGRLAYVGMNCMCTVGFSSLGTFNFAKKSLKNNNTL